MFAIMNLGMVVFAVKLKHVTQLQMYITRTRGWHP